METSGVFRGNGWWFRGSRRGRRRRRGRVLVGRGHGGRRSGGRAGRVRTHVDLFSGLLGVVEAEEVLDEEGGLADAVVLGGLGHLVGGVVAPLEARLRMRTNFVGKWEMDYWPRRRVSIDGRLLLLLSVCLSTSLFPGRARVCRSAYYTPAPFSEAKRVRTGCGWGATTSGELRYRG